MLSLFLPPSSAHLFMYVRMNACLLACLFLFVNRFTCMLLAIYAHTHTSQQYMYVCKRSTLRQTRSQHRKINCAPKPMATRRSQTPKLQYTGSLNPTCKRPKP